MKKINNYTKCVLLLELDNKTWKRINVEITNKIISVYFPFMFKDFSKKSSKFQIYSKKLTMFRFCFHFYLKKKTFVSLP